MLKRASLLFLVAVMVISWCVPALAQEEVVKNDVTEENLLNLVKPYVKDPKSEVTRGAFIQMLAKAANIQEKEVSSVGNLPKDLKRDANYAKSAAALWEKGILKGATDGKVYLDNPVKNIEAKVFVARVWGIPEELIFSKEINAEKTLDSQLLSWIEKYFNRTDKNTLKACDAAKILSDIFKTDEKVSSLVQDSNEKNKDIKSLKVKGDMTLKLVIKPEIPEISTGMNAKFNSEFSKDKKIHQVTDTTIPLIDKPISVEQYMDKNYIYMNVPENEETTKWVKMKNPVSEIFDDNFIASNQCALKDLDIKTPYSLLGTEELEGKKVYKIAFYSRVADMSQFAKIFGSMMGAEKEKQEMLEQVYDIIDLMFVRGIVYIGVEDGLVYNADLDYDIVLGDLGLDNKEIPFKLDSIKASLKFNYYDYNSDIKIDIPEEAKNAEEMEAPTELPEK